MMKIEIIGKPELHNDTSIGAYNTKSNRTKTLDGLNLIAVGRMVAPFLPDNYLLRLDFIKRKFEYVQGSAGFYVLEDGSGESLLHLMGHEWLWNKLSEDSAIPHKRYSHLPALISA